VSGVMTNVNRRAKRRGIKKDVTRGRLKKRGQVGKKKEQQALPRAKGQSGS